MQKPSLPSGTRDFSPDVLRRRKFILAVMEEVFTLFGFEPLETPALENLRTLQGKYGDEGDQLLFKVLNSGDFLAKVDDASLSAKDARAILPAISDRGLRYDLTVPLARYIVMNKDKVQFPFKRYQMQPVWRADRPQKGRYREFWQCDCDIVGSNSLRCDAELLKIYDLVFSLLMLPVRIRINSRAVFDAFLDEFHSERSLVYFLQLLDKYDKIGQAGIINILDNELKEEYVTDRDAMKLLFDNLEYANRGENSAEKLQILMRAYPENEALGTALTQVHGVIKAAGKLKNDLDLDFTLARGLSYYTGMICEVVPEDENIEIGSIGGGGRYDNLTEIFGLKNSPGVGISFGLDRIYDVMEAMGSFESAGPRRPSVLICPMIDAAFEMADRINEELHTIKIVSEVYPVAGKMSKQLDYANNKKILFAIIIGEDELKNKSLSFKDLTSGEQRQIPLSDIGKFFGR